MTTYCQHAPKLRLVRPDGGEHVTERPRHPKTEQFTDGQAGTQVEIHGDERSFDVEYALATGALAALPCGLHPDAKLGASDTPKGKGAGGG